MEYCPLGDVFQHFQDPVSEVVTRNICGQLLEGLGKLHEMGITHRDIKPQVCSSCGYRAARLTCLDRTLW